MSDGELPYCCQQGGYAHEPGGEIHCGTCWDDIAAARYTRLPHCTSVLGRHSEMCLRDGEFCSQDSFHDGPCTPHGKSLVGWVEAEKREAYGR